VVPVADAYAKFLRAPGADGMVQMELVGRVMEGFERYSDR
jgi:hypothetical protein